MAITTLGFEGTIDDVAYSKRSRYEGAALPTVGGRTDFSVTNGSADRSVNIAAGVACAHAIMATSDAVESLQLATVDLVGAIRWDAIALRYAWSANTVTLIAVPGAAGLAAQAVLPSGLRSDVGDTFDQVLALAKVQQGLTAVQLLQDRRYQGHKVFTALSKDTLPPATSQLFGAEAVTADGTRWRCGLDGSNNPAWLSPSTQAVTEITGTAVVAPAIGWVVDPGHVNRCIPGPYWRQIDIEIRRSGAEINANDTNGDFTDAPVAALTDICKPDRPVPVPVLYRTPAGKEFPGSARLDPDGTLSLLNGAPACNVASSTAANYVSLRASIFFARKAA